MGIKWVAAICRQAPGRLDDAISHLVLKSSSMRREQPRLSQISPRPAARDDAQAP